LAEESYEIHDDSCRCDECMTAWEAENYAGRISRAEGGEMEIWLQEHPDGASCGCGYCSVFRRRHPGAAPRVVTESDEVPF
jgi:hypothetical protein